MKIYKITEASEYLGVSINTLKTLAWFVAVPVLSDQDFLYLASIVKVRISQLEKAAEEEENENGKG